MDKRFNIAKKTKDRRLILLISIFAIIELTSWLLIRFGYIKMLNETIVLFLTLLFTLPIFWIVIVPKNYKIIGSLTFENEGLQIKISEEIEKISYSEIDSVYLKYKGTLGEGFGGSISKIGSIAKYDGSGNILKFVANDKKYEINLLLITLNDYKDLKHILSRFK